MKYLSFHILCFLLALQGLFSQEVYVLDPYYPVHDLNKVLEVIADPEEKLNTEKLLSSTELEFMPGTQLPKLLQPNQTYWGRLQFKATDSLKGWHLNFEDKMIGPPAWTKSNGSATVYAFSEGKLVFRLKTGVDIPPAERATNDAWMLNRIPLDEIPIGKEVTLLIKTDGNSFGYPAFFNLSARSPEQAYYHQFNQFHHGFNTFMFGVTFIIFLYFFLQFCYLRDKVYMWFSIWLFFCTITQAMTIGLIIGYMGDFRFPFSMITSNAIFFSFWFFGRSFIESKRKFPLLDKFILGMAVIILMELVLMTLYVFFFKPDFQFMSPGIHFQLLNIYTLLCLIVSVVLTLKKDLFARYFGIGSLIASIFLIIGTLWSMGVIIPPFRLDPYATGIFLQIVIYSFGMSYRSQKLNERSQQEHLEMERSLAEIQRMKDLDEVKTRFFANISHEFRTPLSLINGPLQQAKKGIRDGDESFYLNNKAFSIIKKNTTRLQMLVDQLLDLSRIESGAVHLQLRQGGIVQFVRSQVFSFESLAEQQNISLNTHFPEEIDRAYYDRDKLEKILNNLLSNAFKYTPAGGAVSVSLSKKDNMLLLDISDTGNGMDKKEVDRIFERFYRVEGTEVKGSGIGLALTKELIDLYQGQISVQSEKGRGTTFKVRLPILLKDLPESVLVESPGYSEPASPEKRKGTSSDDEAFTAAAKKTKHLDVVLLIEDNADLREFISDILLSRYTVLTASDGLQGERMAFEHIPDLIISDVMMPKKDGFELCNNLKNNIKTSHIPIIMLTAKAGQSSKMAGLSQGADAYLTKPFNADELLLRAGNLIRARQKIWDHFKSLDLNEVQDLELSAVDDIFLQKVVKFIQENIDNDLLSVEDIASNVGFSRAQLHRKLKALTNKSAGQLLNEIRMNKARILLKNQTGTVSEIAYSVGYSNMSYFTKSFKERFGILPSKVAEENNNRISSK
ncbi:hybrid sensor histidine kinase/response regulator transcription factor [Robiginitalea sp. IMCC43444]|uniref:hybrid sensor histidine kinase/response regulator transcription factor n=1 Tax=Robiginitalea sp. IMCC43444 TaxID=3459121 RepID=UPI004042C9D7